MPKTQETAAFLILGMHHNQGMNIPIKSKVRITTEVVLRSHLIIMPMEQKHLKIFQTNTQAKEAQVCKKWSEANSRD